MEILLHIGPHKTATTSLQQALLKHYGTSNPGTIWYPPPKNHGPGHAELAWDFYDQTTHSHQPSLNSLTRIVSFAEHSGCNQLILSAEDFSHLDDAAITRVHDQIRGHELHLLATLTPFRRRLASTWQEMVKHGYDESLAAFITQIPNLQAMQGNLINRWIEILKPKKTFIVNIQPEASSELVFKEISELTGINLQPDTARLNQGLGGIETHILRFLNASKITRNNLKARSLAMRILNSKPWRLLVPKTQITLPADSEPTILQFCNNHSKHLEALSNLAPNVLMNRQSKAA